MTAQPLLDVKDLTVEFTTRRGIVKAVQHVDITVGKGETLGIVGESGSGKSVTSYAVMRILDRAGKIAEGSVVFSGIDVKAASEAEMRDLRGREISMIFQNPRAALNPIRKVGDQIEDVLRQHVQQSQVADRGEKAIEALEQVKIARPRERYHAYPFELSGGMCQRVVIALALACNPRLLIADEPTTGLDVTTQKAVMDLIVELTKQRGMSTILITHDLGLAAAYCDRVVVMEKGHVVETAMSADIFARPAHPYTKKLMRATPRLGVSLRDLLPEEEAAALRPVAASAPASEDKSQKPLLLVEKLVKEYPRQGATAVMGKLFGRKPPIEQEVFRAVDGISFTVGHGESVGLVGESGCGKSTTSMMVMRLLDQTSGRIMFDGDEIGAIMPHSFARLPLRKSIQMVFQDPTDSLNPALHRRARHCRPDHAARRRQGARRAARPLRGTRRPRRPAAQPARSLSAPALWRPEGPCRHCAGDRAAAEAGNPGRADRGARRFRAGGGAEPAAGPESVHGYELSVCLP